MIQKLPQFAVLTLALGLLLTGCAGSSLPRPNVDYNQGYDFSGIKTFGYLPRRGGPVDSNVISDMEVQRMHQAFARALRARGWEFTEDRDSADILASWHLVAQERTDVRSYNATSFYQCWGCGPSVSDVSVRQYTRGTLIFDLIDQDMRKSVWRGIMQSRIDVSQPAVDQDHFNAIADTMLESFPP